MVRLIRATFYSATDLLVGKDPCSTWLGPFSVAGMYKNYVQDKWDCLGDSDCIRSVGVPSRTVYFYTRAGVEQAYVELRPLMGLLIAEEMWCIWGMLQYSLKSKINLPDWHSVLHVRHILTDYYGIDAWAMNGASFSSLGDLILPNAPLWLLVVSFWTSIRPPVIYSLLQCPPFLRQIPILIDLIINDKLRKNGFVPLR